MTHKAMGSAWGDGLRVKSHHSAQQPLSTSFEATQQALGRNPYELGQVLAPLRLEPSSKWDGC